MNEPGDAYRRHSGEVFAYLRRRVRTDECAEDLTQEVFADLIRALETFQPGPTPVLALLYTVARRRLVDTRRQSARLRIVPLVEASAVSQPNEYGPAVAEALRRAARRLPVGQRGLLAARLIQGRPYRELAAELGVGVPALKMRYVRALDALRVELEREGIEP